MEITIRKAEEKDCERMMELVHDLAVYEKYPEEVTVTFKHFVDSGFGEHPVWWAFVAEVEGKIEGFALWYIRYSTWKGQRMYLEDFIVNETLRGHGIGTRLFDELIAEATEKKFNGIVWQVLDWNETAINFYNKYEGVEIEKGWLNCSLSLTPGKNT